MTFTGRLGTPNSRFGDILFGAVEDNGPGAPDFRAHQLTSTSFRLLFEELVTDGALDPSSYSLSSATGHVPSVLSVEFYEDYPDSVVFHLGSPLTTAALYSVFVSSVETLSGSFIVGVTRSFTANVLDPPRAVGAYLSKRGYVDVLFDRPVGPFSASASFSINPEAGPSVPMTQSPWASEGIPGSTLRLQVPPSVSPSPGFTISTSSVVDGSSNSSSETVPLTLALRSPSPYSYSDISQIQLIDAFVTDVSSDFLRAANVRVFFSCPADFSQASDPGSWGVSAAGAHPAVDDQDQLSEPDAFDLPSLILLVNDIRSSLNAHLVLEKVHLSPASADIVTAPPAFSLPSAVSLLNQLSLRLPSHLLRPLVHEYGDTVNLEEPPQIGDDDLGLAISVANSLRASYSGHILAAYPLSFSDAYHEPVGPITAYVREDVPDGAFDVSGPYTYFCDLRVVLDTEAPDLLVSCSVSSEDGGSACSPSDYTGSIVARSGASPVTVRSSLVAVGSHVDLLCDRNVSPVSESPLVIVGEDGLAVPTSRSVLGSFPALLWAFNNAVEAYRRHIVPGAAGHQTDDGVNIITPADYAFLPIGAAMSSANNVREKVIAHMASATVHYHADPFCVTAPPATDFASFTTLVADLSQVLSSHLVKVGPHSFPGYRMVSAPVFDTVRLSSSLMLDGSLSRASGLLQDSYVYNGPPSLPAPSLPAYRSHVVRVDTPFVALSVRPSLSSVVPQSGLSFDQIRGPVLGSDLLQVFFSKPMREVPVGGSELPVTGGPCQLLGSVWVSPMLVSMAVTNMQPIPYSVTASGLTDLAGNAIY